VRDSIGVIMMEEVKGETLLEHIKDKVAEPSKDNVICHKVMHVNSSVPWEGMLSDDDKKKLKTGIQILAGHSVLPMDYHAENVLWGTIASGLYRTGVGSDNAHPVFIDFGMPSRYGEGQEEEAWRWWKSYALGLDENGCPNRLDVCSEAVKQAIPDGCPGKIPLPDTGLTGMETAGKKKLGGSVNRLRRRLA
jgi:hypothetical protein